MRLPEYSKPVRLAEKLSGTFPKGTKQSRYFLAQRTKSITKRSCLWSFCVHDIYISMSLFKKFTLWQIGLLTATFAFGMAVNLFVPLPGDIGETAFWESGGSWLLRFHVLLALAILILAVLLLIKSRGLGRAAQRQSLGGFSSILLAIIMGIIF